MPRVKIKQLDERVATAGIHMGGGPERRKLQPGEVVDIPEDFENGLLDTLWQTGKLEMTLDPVTRPLDYKNYREAQLHSPTFRSRGPDEDIQVEQTRAAIAARLAEQSEANSPAEDSQPEPATVETTAEPEPAKSTAKNRRAERRAALQRQAVSGEALTT